MNRIIVTIRIKQKKEYDLELPVNQKIKDLMHGYFRFSGRTGSFGIV